MITGDEKMIKNINVKFFKDSLKLDDLNLFLDFIQDLEDYQNKYSNLLFLLNYVFSYGKDDDAKVILQNLLTTGHKIYFYVLYNEDKFNLKEPIDIVNMYGGIYKLSENIIPYNIETNLNNYNFNDLLKYIYNNEPDDIIMNYISKYIIFDEVEDFYTKITAIIFNMLKKYQKLKLYFKDNLWFRIRIFLNNYNKNDFYKFCHYLKDNCDKKEMIYHVLAKLDSLDIKYFDKVFDDSDVNKEYVKSSYKLGVEYKTKEPIYAGCEIYTDGIITYLAQENNNEFPIKVEGAKYVLENEKSEDDEVMLGININIHNHMIIKEFDFNLNTLPTKEELNDIKREVVVNDEAFKKKNVSDLFKSILSCQSKANSLIIDLNKLEENITFLKEKCLDNEQNSNNLRILINELEQVKEKVYAYYKEIGLINAEELKRILTK